MKVILIGLKKSADVERNSNIYWNDANAKAIHIIRDPRSVLASFKNYARYTPYPACLGKYLILTTL